MSDVALVGLAGLFATAVLGPFVAYLIRKDQDARQDIIATLDGAVEALTTARASINWIRSMLIHNVPVRESSLAIEIRRALDEIHAAEAWATRLHLRLGQTPITEAYVDAHAALATLGADVYADYSGTNGPAQADVDRALQVPGGARRRLHRRCSPLARRRDAPGLAVTPSRARCPPGGLSVSSSEAVAGSSVGLIWRPRRPRSSTSPWWR